MDSVLALHPAAPGLILGAPVPKLMEHCLVSGHWDSNKPILYDAGVRKSSWSVRQASTTKMFFCRQLTVVSSLKDTHPVMDTSRT